MKKTVIKRRKRVVAPANGNFSPRPASAQQVVQVQQNVQQHHPSGSADTEMSGMQIPAPVQAQRNHLLVDFTTPRPPTQEAAPVASMQSNGQAVVRPLPAQRKRSISQTMDAESPDGRTNQSIHSILNPNAVPIEPSLLNIGAEVPSERKRAHMVERKTQIEREIQRLQEELEKTNAKLQQFDEANAAPKETVTAPPPTTTVSQN